MGWETRARGGRYYTRSLKRGGRVFREYVGCGLAAELLAEQDAREREQREQARQAHAEEQQRWTEWNACVQDFCNEVELLARAALLAAGYHRHNRGAWRRRSGEERTGEFRTERARESQRGPDPAGGGG